MKKILICGSTANRGGAEKNLYLLCKYLDKKKYNIDVLFLYGKGPISDMLKQEGININFLNAEKNNIFKVFLKLVNIFKKGKYDLIYLWGFKINILGRIAGLITNCKNIIAAQRSVDAHREKIQILLDRYTSKFVKLYISNTNAAIEILAVREKIPRKKMRLVHNGIEFEKYEINYNKSEIKEELKINPYTLIIGVVANLRKAKGHQYLIDALEKLNRNGKDYICLFIGDGELRKDLEKQVRECGIEEKVKFLGVREDVPRLLSIIDIFVLPSLWEGMPNAVMEAMACKKPVIATDVGGVGELVIHGETGYLVQAENSQDLVEKISILLDNKKLRYSMGIKGYERIKRNFTINQMIKQTEKVFEEIIN